MPHLTEAYRGGDESRRAGWRIAFSYDVDTIAALKALIPAADRTWDEERKYWWVEESYEDVLLKLFPGFAAHLNQRTLF